MAYREVSRVEIVEVVRRWQSGISQRCISTGTGLSRATVRRYIEAVVESEQDRPGPAPSEEQLARLAGLSLAGRGCWVLSTSLRRFIVRRGWQRRSLATVRTGPERTRRGGGDGLFGRLGLIEDPATGRRRVAWALIIVLTYSWHSFV